MLLLVSPAARIKLMSFLSKNGFAARDVNCKKRGAFGFSRTPPLLKCLAGFNVMLKQEC